MTSFNNIAVNLTAVAKSNSHSRQLNPANLPHGPVNIALTTRSPLGIGKRFPRRSVEKSIAEMLQNANNRLFNAIRGKHPNNTRNSHAN
jgi:hypothetical protein